MSIHDPEKARPLNDFVLLLKCTNEHVKDDDGKILIVLTDKSLDRTNWLEIVAIGPKCKDLAPDCVGKLVHLPNWSHDLVNVESTFGAGYWMAREKLLRGFVLEAA